MINRLLHDGILDFLPVWCVDRTVIETLLMHGVVDNEHGLWKRLNDLLILSLSALLVFLVLLMLLLLLWNDLLISASDIHLMRQMI